MKNLAKIYCIATVEQLIYAYYMRSKGRILCEHSLYVQSGAESAMNYDNGWMRMECNPVVMPEGTTGLQ